METALSGVQASQHGHLHLHTTRRRLLGGTGWSTPGEMSENGAENEIQSFLWWCSSPQRHWNENTALSPQHQTVRSTMCRGKKTTFVKIPSKRQLTAKAEWVCNRNICQSLPSASECAYLCLASKRHKTSNSTSIICSLWTAATQQKIFSQEEFMLCLFCAIQTDKLAQSGFG